MLTRLIELSLHHRVAVLLGVVVLIAGGGYALSQLDVDAFPDTTPIMVQVNTTAPALSPEEIERQITYPIEQSLSGLPSLENIRSVSKYGFSQVVVTFEDGTDIYFARQVVGERLATVELPGGVSRPKMGPVATGLGEVFHYVLTYPGVDFTKLPESERKRMLTELRTTHDWVVKPQLRTVAGTAEINSWGGYEKQFQVQIDPAGLVSRGLTFGEVVDALQENNRNVGGGNVDRIDQVAHVREHRSACFVEYIVNFDAGRGGGAIGGDSDYQQTFAFRQVELRSHGVAHRNTGDPQPIRAGILHTLHGAFQISTQLAGCVTLQGLIDHSPQLTHGVGLGIRFILGLHPCSGHQYQGGYADLGEPRFPRLLLHLYLPSRLEPTPRTRHFGVR